MKTYLITAGITAGLVLASAISKTVVANDVEVIITANDAAITRAMVAMGRSLVMQVIAEGVETADHVKYLQEVGCHQAQGYFYSRPVPADKFNRKFLSL